MASKLPGNYNSSKKSEILQLITPASYAGLVSRIHQRLGFNPDKTPEEKVEDVGRFFSLWRDLTAPLPVDKPESMEQSGRTADQKYETGEVSDDPF